MLKRGFNGDAYIDLLGNYMIPSVHLLSLPRTWILQQDNVPCNTIYKIIKPGIIIIYFIVFL